MIIKGIFKILFILEIEMELEEKMGKINPKEYCFQMNVSVNKAKSKEIDRLKIRKFICICCK